VLLDIVSGEFVTLFNKPIHELQGLAEELRFVAGAGGFVADEVALVALAADVAFVADFAFVADVALVVAGGS